MKFEEKEELEIPIEKLFSPMIYFLIKNNEVVYVGQSKKGINRPYQHFQLKDYDCFKFINCNEKDLDFLETNYIIKYKPIYNNNTKVFKTDDIISFSKFYYEYYKSLNKRLSYQQAKSKIIQNNLYYFIFKKSLGIKKDRIEEINKILSKN